MNLLVDLADGVVSGASRTPISVTTDTHTTGAAVDLSNGTVWGQAILMGGAFSGTSLDIKLQSNTTSVTTGFTDISGASFTQVTTTGAYEVINFSIPAGRPYIRCTGTSVVTAALLAVAVMAQKKYGAVSSSVQSGADRSPST